MLLVLLLAAMLGTACDRMGIEERVYATYEDAVKAGAVGDEKWIPEIVPPSAKNIREAHILETNELWLSFDFNSSGLALMARRCPRIIEDKIRLPRKRPGKWWPETLVRETKRTLAGEAFQHYECGTKSFLSVDPARNVAYYWALS